MNNINLSYIVRILPTQLLINKRYVLLLFVLLLIRFSNAQNCHCTISEVAENSVTPCQRIVGSVDTVWSASELREAFIQANYIGGNSTILIADGIYQIASPAWYPYLTASNLVIRSLSGERDNVILTGTGMHSVAPGVEIGLFAVGDNITIADLTIRDVGNHGIAATGENLFVHNVKIQNTFEQMVKGTSGANGADNGIVQCSLFEYPEGVGPQFYIGGLDIHDGDNWIVRDNIFKHIASPSGSLAEHAIHFWNHSSNNIIERNIIINCDRGIGFGLGNSPSDGGIIRNNMIYNDGSGLFDDVGIGLESSRNTLVYHNTIFIDYPNAIEYRFDATKEVDIVNNLTNKQIKSRDGGQATLLSNITHANQDWFEDISSGNLRLSSSIIEAIDAATPLQEVNLDIDQTMRPMNQFPDIGAHEFPVTNNATEHEINKSRLNIFPNPANNEINIDLQVFGHFDLDIYSISGKLIFHDKIRISDSPYRIDISAWRPGLYHCNLKNTRDNYIGQIFISP